MDESGRSGELKSSAESRGGVPGRCLGVKLQNQIEDVDL